MAEFLETNSGLKSRIPTTFDFEDYSPDEIAQDLVNLFYNLKKLACQGKAKKEFIESLTK